MGTVTQLVTNGVDHVNYVAGRLVAIDNPAPVIPDGDFQAKVYSIVGMLKWGGMVAGIVGLIVCGVMMIIGRRSRSQTAVEGAIGIPWVLSGLTVIVLAASIVTWVTGF